MTRSVATSAVGTAAAAVGVLAIAATLTLVGLLAVAARGRDDVRPWAGPAWAVAVVASAVELLLRVADLMGPQVGASMVEALTSRRSAAVAARLVVLGVLALVERQPGALSRGEAAATRVAVAVGLVATAMLATPGAGSAAGLVVGAGAAVGGVLVAGALAVLLHRHRPDLRRTGAAVGVPIAAVAVVAALVVWPSGRVGSVNRVVEHETGMFDLSVSPAAPGPNELHLYAFDTRGVPITLEGATVSVGAGVPAQSLLPAGPNHRLSYQLVLPDGDAWSLAVEAVTPDGQRLEATAQVVRP